MNQQQSKTTQQLPPSFLTFPILRSEQKPSTAAQKSSYYVRPETMTPLQKHCAFFDRNHDGLIMPWETFEGFRVLGYNLLMSLLGTFLVHFFFSYWTLDSWIPDPFFAIVLRNVDRVKHGSDTEIYSHDGTLKGAEVAGTDAVVTMLGKWDEAKKGGIGWWELWRMTQNSWDCMDLFGWFAAKIEWIFLFVLVQSNGIIHWNDTRAQYDGSLFHSIEQSRRQAGLIKS